MIHTMALHTYVPLPRARALAATCGYPVAGTRILDEMVTYAFVISGKNIVTNAEYIYETLKYERTPVLRFMYIKKPALILCRDDRIRGIIILIIVIDRGIIIGFS